MSVFDYSFTDNNGNEVNLAQFKGKLLLLVNVASRCGMTSQYEGLQKLHKKYSDKGLVVIGFPCNQFEGQEPGTDSEIKEFCQTTYGVDFLMSTKIDVNGENAHPLFKYLVSEADFDSVPWNFTKFLIDDNFRSMSPTTTPEEIEVFIQGLLK